MAATMEGTLMAAVVAPDASPAEILQSLRGAITSARSAYPDVLHVEVQDSHGDLWRLATQDADWSPSDPNTLLGHSVESAKLDEGSGELRLGLSGGAHLKVIPAPSEADDDPPNWKLLTPGGLALIFGPGGGWQLNRAKELAGLPTAPSSRSEDMIQHLERVEERAEALRFAREEEMLRLVAKSSALRREQLLVVLSVGLSIISIAVAAIALAFALH